MGVWGAGNFDNDYALDFVSEIAETVKDELSPPEDVEDIEVVMGAVAVYKALVEHCSAAPPTSEELLSLKQSIIDIYDKSIDELDPAPDYKVARRQVIIETFDGFLELLNR